MSCWKRIITMDPLILWAILLLAAALALFFLELFIPSGGIIGVTAVLCLISSLVMFFFWDTMTGVVATGLIALALPFLALAALKLWPHSPIARYFTLTMQQERLTQPEQPANPESETLVSSEGQALTDLRPVGTCLIKGQRHECLAASRVKVVSVDGMNVKVKEIS